MEVMGHHYIAELSECPENVMDDKELLHRLALKAAKSAGVTVLGSHFHKFSPQGVTGLLLLAESHFSVHTWPERGYCAVDLFTCGDATAARIAVKEFARQVEAGRVVLSEVKRGMISEHAQTPRLIEEKSPWMRPTLVQTKEKEETPKATILPFHNPND